MNKVILTGRLTRDPELRHVPEGQAVVNFTLAVDRDLSKAKREELQNANKPTADFIRVVVWGKQAEVCANYLEKGRLVCVDGRIQTSSSEDADGNRKFYTDVVANRVEFLGGAGKSNQEVAEFSPTDDNDIPF